MKNEVIATENGIASTQDLANLPTNRLVSGACYADIVISGRRKGEKTMKNEVIATENGIASTQDLANLPTNRLVGIFNSLPGVTQVKKFTNRTIGIKRLAAAFGLELPVESISLAVAKEGVAKAPKAKKSPKAKAKKALKAKKATGTHKDAKKAEVIRQLGLANGASLEKIMETTGWQAHTVRGFISILGKTMKIESFKTDAGVRTYRAK